MSLRAVQGMAVRETIPERLWREYLEARERAEISRHIDDGMAAGRAWAKFIQEFVGK